ncbi:MAG: hypothetical protein IMZ65_04280, partial [Planctomycetes bacterium]|nr:hypothetical protein [Planctomycetota bacterium]
ILVRRSAAGRLGLEPAAEAPNLLVATIDVPGRLEEAMVLARPLWPDRRIAVRPIDWALDPAGGPRRLGLVALALILAGGSLVVATVLPALGRLGEDARAPASWVADGARLLGGRADYGVVVAAMMAALAAGAAWGGPPGAGDLARELVAEPMARVGLESAAPEAGQLLGFFVTAMMTNVLLWGLVAIGAAGLVPGLGLALALAQMLAWGVTLTPDTLTLLDRLPLRAAVAVVEAGGYALLALGSWRVLVGTVRPQALGQERVRQGYGAGLSHLYRLIAPAVALVVVAAALETVLLAVVGHWR